MSLLRILLIVTFTISSFSAAQHLVYPPAHSPANNHHHHPHHHPHPHPPAESPTHEDKELIFPNRPLVKSPYIIHSDAESEAKELIFPNPPREGSPSIIHGDDVIVLHEGHHHHQSPPPANAPQHGDNWVYAPAPAPVNVATTIRSVSFVGIMAILGAVLLI